MNFLVKILILFFLFVCPVFVGAENINFPSFPMAFWGTAKVNNQNLPVGTIIKAYCGNNLSGQVVMQEAGIYGYNDSAKTKLLVSSCVENIIFKYTPNETTEIQYVDEFAVDQVVNLNLNFTTNQENNISEDGGGGGMSGTPQLNQSNQFDFGILGLSIMMSEWGKTGLNLFADLNKDEKINILDFSILMANWK